MRSGGLLLRVLPALRTAAGRVLLAGLLLSLLVPGTTAGAGGPARLPDGGRTEAAPLPPPPGTTRLVSRAADKGFANGASIEPAISGNGRYVVFTSVATDIAGKPAATRQVYLADRSTGKTVQVPLPQKLAAGGTASGPAISSDGKVVAYSYRPGAPAGAVTSPVNYVVVWVRGARTASAISPAPQGTGATGATEPTLSADGRYIAYTFNSALNPANAILDVVVVRTVVIWYDRKTSTGAFVSVDPKGSLAPGDATAPSISADGNVVAFVSNGMYPFVDGNPGEGPQVYVRDMAAKRTDLASRSVDGSAPSGTAREPAISANGRYVAFSSTAKNLVSGPGAGAGGVFRRDRRTGQTILVSLTPAGAASSGGSGQPSISSDGSIVAFAANSTDLLGSVGSRVGLAALSTRLPSEVYIRDIEAGDTQLISVAAAGPSGGPAGGSSLLPSVSADGRFTAFTGDSPNIVSGDQNESFDVFVRDMPPMPLIAPAALDLGASAVGIQGPPLAATLTNAGWGPLTVTGSTITGKAKADFRIVADLCKGQRLRRNMACTVSVSFKPTTKGTRAATLAVADSYTGSPRTVALRGSASQAKLELDPPIGPPGIVVIANGSGFPPGKPVRLAWDKGITPTIADFLADKNGAFRVPVIVFHGDMTGKRNLVASSVTGTDFPPATAEMLVAKPSVVPPMFDWARFIDLPIFFVFRG